MSALGFLSVCSGFHFLVLTEQNLFTPIMPVHVLLTAHNSLRVGGTPPGCLFILAAHYDNRIHLVSENLASQLVPIVSGPYHTPLLSVNLVQWWHLHLQPWVWTLGDADTFSL